MKRKKTPDQTVVNDSHANHVLDLMIARRMSELLKQEIVMNQNGSMICIVAVMALMQDQMAEALEELELNLAVKSWSQV
jgi:hypothetical protein